MTLFFDLIEMVVVNCFLYFTMWCSDHPGVIDMPQPARHLPQEPHPPLSQNPQSMPPPPPPAKTKPRIVSMVPVKNCCEATEAWVDRVITRVGLRVVWHTSWYMYAVYAPVPYLRKQTSWLSLWWQNGGSFFSLLSTLLDLVIRCEDRDLTRIDAQDTVVAGLQAALIVTAFAWLLERSRVSEWPCFRLSNCPDNHTR